MPTQFLHGTVSDQGPSHESLVTSWPIDILPEGRQLAVMGTFERDHGAGGVYQMATMYITIVCCLVVVVVQNVVYPWLSCQRLDVVLLPTYYSNSCDSCGTDGRGPKMQVPVAIPMALSDPLPSDLTDLELFRKFCMPMGSTDLWKEVPRIYLSFWGATRSSK